MSAKPRRLALVNDHCGFREPPKRFLRVTDDESQPHDTHSPECEAGGRDFSVPFDVVLSKVLPEHPSVAMDAGVLSGVPRVRGTRIPLYMVIDAVIHYGSVEGVLTAYRDITSEQVKDALAFAADVLEHRVEFEP